MSKGLFTKALRVALTLGAVVGCSAPPPMSHCIIIRKEHQAAYTQCVVHHTGGKYPSTWVQYIHHPERWTVDVSGLVSSNRYDVRTIQIPECEWATITNGMRYHDI